MFLDEELEQIEAQNLPPRERTVFFLKTMINRLPSEEEGMDNARIEIKKIDNGWRLFTKRHSVYSPDFWRKWVLKDDTDGKFKEYLGWK